MRPFGIGVLGAVAGLLALGVGLFVASQALAAPATIRAGSGSTAVGTQRAIDIDSLAMAAPGLGAWAINITYDPSIVTPVDCSGLTAACNLHFNANTIRLAGASAQGLLGDRTIATVTFRCDAPGTSALGVSFDTLADATPAHPVNIDAATASGSVRCVTQVTAAASSATIKAGSANAAVGGNATVQVQSLGVEAPGLGAWTIDVNYNAGVVNAVSCSPGAQGLAACNADFDSNTVRVTGASVAGLVGDSTLGNITFHCGVVGTSALQVSVSVLADATISSPHAIDAVTINGSINCTEGQTSSGGIRCSDFAYQEDAQAVLDGDRTDPLGLDPDHDGIACEDLPNKPIVGGATYTGIVAGGGTIKITVSPDGKGVSLIELNGVVTHCATISYRSTVSPPEPIDLPNISVFSHTFEAGPPQAPLTVTVTGQFKNSATIAGSIDVTSDTDPQCVDLNHEFVASVTGAVTPIINPAPRPPGPSGGLPSAGSGGLGFDTANPLTWLIAGLMGAGLAWIASGIAGAGFATATGSTVPSSPPVLPQQPEEWTMTVNLPRSIPTWRHRALGQAPNPVEPDRFQPSVRP